eukprot:6070049-Amphidinium_carterae.1
MPCGLSGDKALPFEQRELMQQSHAGTMPLQSARPRKRSTASATNVSHFGEMNPRGNQSHMSSETFHGSNASASQHVSGPFIPRGGCQIEHPPQSFFPHSVAHGGPK